MARSVSVPRNATAVAYIDATGFGMMHPYDPETDQYDESADLVYDEFQSQCDFDHFMEHTVDRLMEMFPSMKPVDDWIDNEERVIAENYLARVGISEYMGLISLWMIPHEFDWYDANLVNLADQWTSRVSAKFEAAFTEMVKVGTFSNGEAVFAPVARKTA